MDTRILTKVNQKFQTLKDTILTDIQNKTPEEIYDYIRKLEIKIEPSDLNKRKRTNNVVPID